MATDPLVLLVSPAATRLPSSPHARPLQTRTPAGLRRWLGTVLPVEGSAVSLGVYGPHPQPQASSPSSRGPRCVVFLFPS